MISEHQLRKDMCEVGRRMYHKNFVAASDGNISILMDDGNILVTPSGTNKGRLGEEDLVVTSFQGEKLYGKLAPSSELEMHLTVYRNRPDVKAAFQEQTPWPDSLAPPAKRW